MLNTPAKNNIKHKIDENINYLSVCNIFAHADFAKSRVKNGTWGWSPIHGSIRHTNIQTDTHTNRQTFRTYLALHVHDADGVGSVTNYKLLSVSR